MADAKAEGLKAEGNKHFQRGKFKQAISKYTEALNVSRHHVYYSNRAAAYLKLGKASKALKDSNSCVELAPTWVKGYLRKGAALQALHRYEEEIAAYQSGLEYDKQNSDILAALEQVMARRRKDEEQKKKVKSNKSMQKPTPALNASDFSDPKKVALIIEQIGVHGTDLKKNAADPLGDGDQSVLPSDGPDAKYLRELWNTGGDVKELCRTEQLDTFALKCVSGHRDGVQAALEVLSTAQKTKLMEKRRSILRLPAIWFPLFGHVHIRGYPPPDYVGTLRLLLEHGARPDARDICGKTFVHYASGPLCIDAMVFEMMDTVIEASKKTDRANCTKSMANHSLHPIRTDLMDHGHTHSRACCVLQEALQEIPLVDLQDRFGEVALVQPITHNRLDIVKHLCEIHGANGRIGPAGGPSPLKLAQSIHNSTMHKIVATATEKAVQHKVNSSKNKKTTIIVRPSTNKTFTSMMGIASSAPFLQWEGADSTPSVPKGTFFDVKVSVGSFTSALLVSNQTRDFCVYVESDNCHQKTELWRLVKRFVGVDGKKAFCKAKLKKGKLIIYSEPFLRDW